jgi:V8-like Glu-specific endopeptidase
MLPCNGKTGGGNLFPQTVSREVVMKFFVFLVLFPLAALLSAAPGLAAHEDASAVRARTLVTAPVESTALSYWTPERMMKAQPVPMMRPGRPAVSAVPAPRHLGPEGSGESGLPGNQIDSPMEHAAPFTAIVANPQGYTYPPPFGRYENFDDYSVFPYRTIAKIFFSDGGKDYVCSGATWPNRAVLTAGHCVYDNLGGHWRTNVIVVPQYKNGQTPIGVFSADSLTTPQGYMDGDQAYDMGLILTKTRDGRKISYYTGFLGIKFNVSSTQHWTVLGYPQAKPFNGKTQQICQSSFAYEDTGMGTIGVGCDMTGGSSGGPWILRFSGKAGGWNFVNGLMSYKYNTAPKASYSPYFGAAAKSLWDYAKNHQ